MGHFSLAFHYNHYSKTCGDTNKNETLNLIRFYSSAFELLSGIACGKIGHAFTNLGRSKRVTGGSSLQKIQSTKSCKNNVFEHRSNK